MANRRAPVAGSAMLQRALGDAGRALIPTLSASGSTALRGNGLRALSIAIHTETLRESPHQRTSLQRCIAPLTRNVRAPREIAQATRSMISSGGFGRFGANR